MKDRDNQGRGVCSSVAILDIFFDFCRFARPSASLAFVDPNRAYFRPSRQLWRAGHRRWDVENDLFNTLSTHWALDHCFKHDPTAIVNFILTLFIAFVLLQRFYLRNLNAESI